MNFYRFSIDPLNVLRHARNKDNSCLVVMADCTLSKLSINISYGLNPCIEFLMNSSLLGTKKEAEVSHQLTGVFGRHFWSWCGLVVVRMGTDELHRQSKLPVLSKSSCCVESNMVCIGRPVKCHRNLLQRLRHSHSSLQAHTKTGTSETKTLQYASLKTYYFNSNQVSSSQNGKNSLKG